MKKLIALLLILLPLPAFAMEDYGNVEFVYGWQQADGSYQAAVVFNLNEGWKTYWRVPGPAGLPTSFNWTGSSNIKDLRVEWPAPHIFEAFGTFSFGYKGRFMLPVHFTPANPAKPVKIDVAMEFGVCKDICIPGSARLTGTLSSGMAATDKAAILAALAQREVDGSRAGVKSAHCALVPNASGFQITAKLGLSRPPANDRVVVIEYDDPDVWIDVTTLSGSNSNVIATSQLEYYGVGMFALDRSRLRLTILEGGKAISVSGCPAG